MHNHLYLTTNETKNISSLLTSSPCDRLKQLISNQSQGIDTSEYINNTIKVILQKKPTASTLKLFYTYITLIPKKDNDGRVLGEVLLLTNQIRKDLQSVNEYIRGATMQCVLSFLDLPEVLDNFYKPIKENISHKHSYVRRWAAHVLSEIYFTNTEKYCEIKEVIYNSLMVERDSTCMRQMIIELFRVDKERALAYEPSVSETPAPVLEVIVRNTKNLSYVNLCLEKIPFYAGIILLKSKEHKNQYDKIFNLLFKCERKKDAIKETIDMDFNTGMLKGYLNVFLQIVKEDESFLFYPNLLDFLFEVCNSNEINYLIEEMCSILKNSNNTLKLFLIQKLGVIINNYSLTSNDLLEEVQKCVNHDDPAISYESLKFLSEQKEVVNIIHLEKIKYGKIFRKALSVIKNKIKREEDVINKIVIFEDALLVKESSNKRLPVLESLYNEESPFIGSSVALFFDSLSKRLFLSDESKARIIALLLKFILQGEKTNKIDKSSHALILMCIKNIYLRKKRKEINLQTNFQETINKKGSFLEPVTFSLISKKKRFFENTFNEKIEEKDFVKQLTGISDPIYCEANIKIVKYDIFIDLIVINQTNSMLQNINIDFTTSSNLSLQSSITTISNLSARSVKNIILSFKVEECSDSFLCGSIKFNCPGDKGQYSGSFYSINLEEIKFEVKDFLGGISFIATENIFREEWVKLEWENTYSVKICKSIKNGLNHVRDSICKALKGKILSEEGDDSYLVSNVICGTLLGDDILINMLMSSDDSINLECRVRSGSENIVKSISALISEGVKGI
ncbi:coatomer subunit beta [Conglomerata obtusa]